MAQKDPTWGYVTDKQADSLKHTLLIEKNDTLNMAALRSLGFYYQDFIPDSGLYFHEKHLALAKKLNMKIWQADGYSQAAYCYMASGNIMKAYEYFSEAMKLAEDETSESDNWRPWTFSNAENSHDARIAVLGMNYQMMGNLWGNLGEPEKQKAYYQKVVTLGESINNGKMIYNGTVSLTRRMSPDSAILSYKEGIEIAARAGFKRVGGIYTTISILYWRKGEIDSAMIFVRKSIARNRADNNLRNLSQSYDWISYLFELQNNKDSSLFYAKKTLEAAQTTRLPEDLIVAYQGLSSANQLNNNTDSAFKYEKLSNRLNDSLQRARIRNLTSYQKFAFNEQLRLKKLDEEKTAYVNTLKIAGLIAVLGTILLETIILYRNNKQKQKANKVLETALTNLKSSQSQLIQSEKMASLGELTAGIAHEIQNPLNFVNNFSEVNTELIEEAGQEMEKGNVTEVKAILKDIRENEQKINHHGKRADAIVKGMLQHSRSSSGQKEPTDINALCDEYLRLSYHGLRAKDKSFNAKFETDFDAILPKLNVIPQDIGRVVLNLINNAFYAVSERANNQQLPTNNPPYEPKVTISTKNLGDKIEIRVSDNGPGIPDSIKEKIFQPFFTTKPTGQGTGLGLSLSYDIVTKGHGGKLEMETSPVNGTEFIIKLPVI